jgi:hypothetical protein
MSMTLLAITPEIQDRIKEIKTYSEANPYSIEDIQKMIDKSVPPAGDMPEHRIFIDKIWKIVYSVNIHPEVGEIRQMSISLDRPNAMPNPHVVELVMALFGFKNSLTNCVIDLEDCGRGVQAVNVAEIIV